MIRARRRPRTFDTRPGDRIIFGGAVYVLTQNNQTGELDAYDESDPFYSPENQARLRQSIEDAEAGRLTEHELIRV